MFEVTAIFFMSNTVRKTSKHLFIYAVGNFLIKLMGLILLPIYTRELSLDDFGIYSVFEISAQIMIAVISLNLSTGMLRQISETENRALQKQTIFTTIIVSGFFSILIFLLVSFSSAQISNFFFANRNYTFLIILVATNVFFEVYNKIPLNLIRFLEKPVFYSFAVISKFLTSTLAIIYFIVMQNMKIEGIFLGLITGNLVFFILTSKMVWQNISFRWDKKIAKDLIVYSVPLVLGSFAMMLFTAGDRYVIKLFCSFSEVGIYSFAAKISRVVNMIIVQSFNLALLPIVFKVYKTAKGKEFMNSIAQLITVLISIIFVGISYFAYGFLELLVGNEEYLLGFNIILILVFAYIFNALRYIFMLHLYVSNRTHISSFILMAIAVLNIGLNFIFVNFFGYQGAAYATMISTFLMMLAFYYFGKKYYSVKYDVLKIMAVTFIALLFVLPFSLGFIPQIIWIKIPLFLAFIAILLLTKLFDLKKVF